jgi:hypothetical protein
MRTIPLKLRKLIDIDPFYRHCIIGRTCQGRIQIHHGFIYSGKQQSKSWALVPLCAKHHAEEYKHRHAIWKVMLTRMPLDDELFYSKVDWKQLKKVFLGGDRIGS